MGTDALGTVSKNSTGDTALTKTDLIAEVSRVAELPRNEAALIVERILDSVVHAIQRGDKVEIRGFGSFHTRTRQARIGRNPKTGARVEVAAKKVPFFKPSRELRERLKMLASSTATDK
jgi:integration host factor subunit beta